MATTSLAVFQPSLSPSVGSPCLINQTRREIVVSLPLCNYTSFESVQLGPIRLSTSCRTRTSAQISDGGDRIVNCPLVGSSGDDPDDDDETSSVDVVDENELKRHEGHPWGEIEFGGASSESISISGEKEEIEMKPRLPERDYAGTPYVPVYVMLPLGLINMSCELVDPDGLMERLKVLKSIDVDGVMVDCWWGIVEYATQQYNWAGYKKLFHIVRDLALKLQVVMSFHECGGNVGDDVHIPLPHWITELGQQNPDIYFTDREGTRNGECLSWGVDKERVLRGRTAVEVLHSDTELLG